MPVPTLITELSTTAASNSPPGSESPASLDDYQRAHASFIAQIRDGTVAVAGTGLTGTAAALSIGGTAATATNLVGLNAPSGASLVGYMPAGTGAVATVVQTKLRERVSVKDFGAVGDGVTDDYQAWVNAYASLPDTGGTITFPSTPANKWYLSQGIVLNKPVRVVGQLPSSSLNVLNTGTVLLFAPDKTGITINSYNSVGANPSGTPAGNFCEITKLSVVSKGGATGLLNGGTGAVCDGILNRGPGTRITNVWTDSFKRNGTRISAAIGSGGVTEGNANLWYMNDVMCLRNGSDGLYVNGADANSGLALKVNCSNNGGYGIIDTSFLGNTYIGCHTDGNTLGPIVSSGATNSSIYIGCYAETGEAYIEAPSVMIGGLNSSNAHVTATSTGLVLNGSASFRAPYKHINVKGAVTVGGAVGQNNTSMTVQTWGASTESATTDAWKLKFFDTENVWVIQYADSYLFQPIAYPNSTGTLWTNKKFSGPIFQNGYAIKAEGATYASAKVRKLATAPPTVDTYEQGDIYYNSAPVSGGFIGWVCVTGGAPGTWKTFGLIS